MRILHARKLDQEAVAGSSYPLPLDHRLGDAELVDSVPDGLFGLFDRLITDLKGHVGLDRQDVLAVTGRRGPIGEVLLDDGLHVPLFFEIVVVHHDLVVTGTVDSIVFYAGLFHLLFHLENGLIGHDLDGVIGLHLENQMHTALEIEAKLDFLFNG